jgi:hypothetical protein
MRLPPGHRAFAAMTLFKFLFSNPPPPNMRGSFVVFLAFFYWQNVNNSPPISVMIVHLVSLPRDSLFQLKCSYHRFHFTSHLRNVS